MARLRKPLGPPKRGGKIDHPDLFEWAIAKAIPATLEAVVGDVSAASDKAVPALFLAFLAIWLTMPDDSTLKAILGFATLASLIFAMVVWIVRARRSRMRPSSVVGWHSFALIGGILVTILVVASGVYQDRVRSSVRQEEAEKQRRDDEASRTASAEAKKQALIAQDAAARAAAAKDEAARASENAKAQIAEAACLEARQDAVQKATRAQSSAHKALDDCKTQYNETLVTFRTIREFCKPAFGRVDSARAQLAAATAKSCDSDSAGNTGSINKAK